MHSPKLCLRLPKTLMLSSLSTCSLFVFSSFCWHYNSFTKSRKDSIISFLDFWVTSLSLSLFSYANSTLGGEGQLTKFSRQENKLFSLHWPPRVVIFKKTYTASLTNCLRGEAVAKFPKVSKKEYSRLPSEGNGVSKGTSGQRTASTSDRGEAM